MRKDKSSLPTYSNCSLIYLPCINSINVILHEINLLFMYHCIRTWQVVASTTAIVMIHHSIAAQAIDDHTILPPCKQRVMMIATDASKVNWETRPFQCCYVCVYMWMTHPLFHWLTWINVIGSIFSPVSTRRWLFISRNSYFSSSSCCFYFFPLTDSCTFISSSSSCNIIAANAYTDLLNAYLINYFLIYQTFIGSFSFQFNWLIWWHFTSCTRVQLVPSCNLDDVY